MTALKDALKGRSLYHFTDRRNIDSIKAHGGLYSFRELSKRGVQIIAAGGNQWSRDAATKSGLDDFISLCFFDSHPMVHTAQSEQRIGQVVFLRVSVDVLDSNDVLISSEVSNKAGAELWSQDEAIKKIDLEIITKRTEWKDPAINARLQKAKKYEILIRNHVPIKLISGI